MNELKFNSQICTTKEQSQLLWELGLKPETADMLYMQIDGSWICIISQGDEEYIPYEDHFPAWSLHRLIELGGFNIECKGIFLRVTGTYICESCDKIYDTIIDSIEALITENLFNKEYLKQ